MALRKFTLDTGAQVVLCPKHSAGVRDHVSLDEGTQQGGAWRCVVCTVQRRLAGGEANAVFVFVNDYVVTRYPTGAVYCTCRGWQFKKVDPAVRTCKHTDAAVLRQWRGAQPVD